MDRATPWQISSSLFISASRVSGFKVRHIPLNKTSSQTILGDLPPSIMPKLKMAGWKVSFSLAIRVWMAKRIWAAIKMASTPWWG